MPGIDESRFRGRLSAKGLCEMEGGKGMYTSPVGVRRFGKQEDKKKGRKKERKKDI